MPEASEKAVLDMYAIAAMREVYRNGTTDPEQLAKSAFAIAQAMLNERRTVYNTLTSA